MTGQLPAAFGQTKNALPALVAAAGARASMRFLEFFAANIRNAHTRRAYARAADEFLAWRASAGVPSDYYRLIQSSAIATELAARPQKPRFRNQELWCAGKTGKE
jgi:hypothetical protein